MGAVSGLLYREFIQYTAIILQFQCTDTYVGRAAHEISNATFYKLLENRQPIYFQATCRMYHGIFPCAARTKNNVAVSPATKLPRVWSALSAFVSSQTVGGTLQSPNQTKFFFLP